MVSVRSTVVLRSVLAAPRRAGSRVGLVPTMGALHEGHLSLLRRAREECDVVVMSLFVNPRQFNDAGDLAGYPRDEARDAQLAAGCGVDALFAPGVEEVYPDGFATTISVGGPAQGLESANRGPAHFDGVATVVAKLLLAAQPDVGYFGAKDAQQVAVVRRMVSDLGLGVEIEVCPTVREDDGLAMSSRNVRLSAGERERAAALYCALERVRAAVAAGQRDPGAATAAGRVALADAGAQIEYLEVVDPITMTALSPIDRDGLAVVAARIGAVRLIDNVAVTVPTSHARW